MTDLVRVSDAERESVAERLRRAHAEGRLDTTELEERVARCYAAKTRAELEPLVADLPGARLRRSRPRGGNVSAFAFPPFVLLALLFAAFVFFGFGHYPLPLVPILFFICFRVGVRGRHRYR